jgi:hypothetical protein
MAMTPQERTEVAQSDDGRQGWVTVRVMTDGGELRLTDGDGARVDEWNARDLVWDPAP